MSSLANPNMLFSALLRALIISTSILQSLAHSPSLDSRAPPPAAPQNDLTIETPFPSDFPALAALSNVTLLKPAIDARLLNATLPIPYSRLTLITTYAAAAAVSEDSYALLSWGQYKVLRLILQGTDTEAPLQVTEGPVRGSGRTFSYTIDEYAVGPEKLRMSDVATICAGLVMLLNHLRVTLLKFEVARDGVFPSLMKGTLLNQNRVGGDEVAVD